MTADLLAGFEPQIEAITLIPSSDGRFEVTVNDRLVFSKLSVSRHAMDGEVVEIIRKIIEEEQ